MTDNVWRDFITIRYKEQSILKLVDIIVMSDEYRTGDPYWDNVTKLLLCSLFYYFMEIGKEEDKNFANVLELINEELNVKIEDSEKSKLDIIFDKRKEEEPNALSVKFYNEFKQAAGKTVVTVLIGTLAMIKHWLLKKNILVK